MFKGPSETTSYLEERRDCLFSERAPHLRSQSISRTVNIVEHHIQTCSATDLSSTPSQVFWPVSFIRWIIVAQPLFALRLKSHAVLAFICLLLCTVSSPIVRGINLFRVSTRTTTSSSNGLEEVSFGVLGGCGTTSAFRLVDTMFKKKRRNELTKFSSSFGSSARAGSLVCTSPELSYEILTREMYQASQGSYTSRSAVLVDHNTTSALIMNPITAGLAGLGMILACIAALVRGRVMHGASLTVFTLSTLTIDD